MGEAGKNRTREGRIVAHETMGQQFFEKQAGSAYGYMAEGSRCF